MSIESEHGPLFSEFESPLYDTWRTLVDSQLKGVPFDKKLITQSLEGVTVQPLYTRHHPEDTKKNVPLPGEYPFTRSAAPQGKTPDGWRILQTMSVSQPKAFNNIARVDKDTGINGFSIKLDSLTKRGLDPEQVAENSQWEEGLSITNLKDLRQAIENMALARLYLQIDAGFSSLPLLSFLLGIAKQTGQPVEKINGAFINDPMATLLEQGVSHRPMDSLYQELAVSASWSIRRMPAFKMIGVDGRLIREAGGTIPQELSFVLASAVETIRRLMIKGLSIDDIASCMTLHLAIGPEFFLEIAKIRAIRTLWAQMIKAFGGNETSQRAHVSLHSALVNKTALDPHVNILRSTTEAFSAVLSGADTIAIAPFNQVTGSGDPLSRRIARNIQIILKEECHGNHVTDPGGGAWFIESSTQQIAEKAWTLFQEIEKNSGIVSALETGGFQKQVAESRRLRAEAFACRKHVLVGTNMYANLTEDSPPNTTTDTDWWQTRVSEVARLKENRDPLKLMTKWVSDECVTETTADAIMEELLIATMEGRTLGELSDSLHPGPGEATPRVDPLFPLRSSLEYEALRNASDAFLKRNGQRPQVHLATIGNLREYAARADFSTAFLQPGGFEVLQGGDCETIEEVIEKAVNSRIKVIVICGTDDQYKQHAGAIASEMKRQNPDIIIVLAGYPKDSIEQLSASGVDEFIHLKANNLQVLKKLHTAVGVTD